MPFMLLVMLSILISTMRHSIAHESVMQPRFMADGTVSDAWCTSETRLMRDLDHSPYSWPPYAITAAKI